MGQRAWPSAALKRQSAVRHRPSPLIRESRLFATSPKRVIRLGSGCCSQGSLVQLFIVRETQTSPHVNRPGPSVATVAVPRDIKNHHNPKTR